MGDQFRTFQTVKRYEAALARHGQWIRWIQSIKCPCLVNNSMNPDPSCDQCNGRGRLFFTPGQFRILDETAKHDGNGKIYPAYTPVVDGTQSVYHQGTALALSGSQPSDGSYIQLASPYPELYRTLQISYEFTPDISITSEDSEVYSTNVLRTVATRFVDRGKSFEGSVKSVSRVYNVTRDETYTVSSATKEYIYLDAMGTWMAGDVLEVDYVYIKPFYFMMSAVTGKMAYEQAYILPEADSILVTPYWAQVSPEDLFTAMAQEQLASVVVRPTAPSGNDVINSHFDLSRLIRLVDKLGNSYTVGPGKNVEIYGRNELQWNITKPTKAYTVQFTYHPTYTALVNLHTLRNAENKAFVNRINLKRYEHIHSKEVY